MTRVRLEVVVATVVDVVDGRPVLSGPYGSVNGPAAAEWALPYSYSPVRGDSVVVYALGERRFVTAVLSGRGRSTVAFRGACGIGAAGGQLMLRGDRGVRLRAPRVSLLARVGFETVASSLVSKCRELCCTVFGRRAMRAGACTRVVDGQDRVVAGSSSRVARRSVKIDGDVMILS